MLYTAAKRHAELRARLMCSGRMLMKAPVIRWSAFMLQEPPILTSSVWMGVLARANVRHVVGTDLV